MKEKERVRCEVVGGAREIDSRRHSSDRGFGLSDFCLAARAVKM